MLDILWGGTPPLWRILIGQTMILVLQVATFMLLLRRMRDYHNAKMKQAVDLMVDHQKINELIAAAVETANAAKAIIVQEAVLSSAAEVRQHVVDEAATVKTAVEAAQAKVQKVRVVNTPLPIVPKEP